MVGWIRRAGRKPLLVGILTPCIAAGALFGWRASLIRRADKQETMLRSIVQQGGVFSLDTDFIDTPEYGPPRWLKSLIGERYFSNIISINLGATEFTDENLVQFATLKHLQSLGVWCTHTSDVSLETVARFKELETLDISQTDVSDEGLKRVAKFANLRVLVVGGDRITERGLEHLKQMSKLNMLCVVGNHFGLPAKKGLEQSLPETTVIFVPLPQVAGGAPRVPMANPSEPAAKPQPPASVQPPPGRKMSPPRGQFT